MGSCEKNRGFILIDSHCPNVGHFENKKKKIMKIMRYRIVYSNKLDEMIEIIELENHHF